MLIIVQISPVWNVLNFVDSTFLGTGRKLSGCAIADKDDTIEALRAAKATAVPGVKFALCVLPPVVVSFLEGCSLTFPQRKRPTGTGRTLSSNLFKMSKYPARTSL